MENFIFTVVAFARNISFGMKVLISNQLFLGFAAGFLISILVHGYFISDKVRRICATPLDRIKKIGGESYFSLAGILNIAKISLSFSLFLFLLIILIALIKF